MFIPISIDICAQTSATIWFCNKGVGSLSVVLMHSIHVSCYQFYLMELSHKL